MNRVNTIGLRTYIKPWLGKDGEEISETGVTFVKIKVSPLFSVCPSFHTISGIP